jgi:hypothetical protein
MQALVELALMVLILGGARVDGGTSAALAVLLVLAVAIIEAAIAATTVIAAITAIVAINTAAAIAADIGPTPTITAIIPVGAQLPLMWVSAAWSLRSPATTTMRVQSATAFDGSNHIIRVPAHTKTIMNIGTHALKRIRKECFAVVFPLKARKL